MKAAFIEKFGDSSVIQISKDFPKPKLETDTDVLVEVHAASLNPLDWKFRSGMTSIIMTYKFPQILGHDFSGVILDVGKKVQKFKKGDEVFCCAPYGRIGSIAEEIVVNECFLAIKPTEINMVEAAGIPLVGMTCMQAFRAAKLKPKDKVLIIGGAGGAGSFAVQYAKKVMDLHVITTCSTKKIEICKSLGADEVIDYTKDDYTTKLKDIDFVYDTAGEAEKTFSILKYGGICRSIATVPDSSAVASAGLEIGYTVSMLLNTMSAKTRLMAYFKSVDYGYTFIKTNGADLEKISKWISEGKIKPLMDKVFDFEQTKEAFEYIEAGKSVGKNCIKIKE
eukprot:gene8637-584_t